MFVYLLKIGLCLSESLWQQVGSPSKFEPYLPGYTWVPPLPAMLSGGIQAPPKEVIRGTTMRIVVDPEAASRYVTQATELINQGRFAEALEPLEQA
ncbi:MAG: hypothetical protein HC929_15450 [Leptolyngbyaceae cyanobacterium SM2_5_2]|nr:hypothetical protein [Leptolyngbyaceae cyanobacterium SM2_5_2]